MRKIFLAPLFALLMALVLTMPEASAAENPPLISVDGHGVVEAAPDQADITLGVVTRAETAEAAQAENRAVANRILRALNALDIDERDIGTDDYSFRPDYSRSENNQVVVTGYTVSNMIRVHIRNLSLVGPAVDAALAEGANTVHSLEFSVGDTNALRRAALGAAVRDAKEKAEILASALGKRIAGVQHVSENTHMFQSKRANAAVFAEESRAADVTPVEPGTLSLSADVHIDFLLAN